MLFCFRCTACRAGIVKAWIESVEVFSIQLFLDGAKCFTKSLEMYHFPCTQETDRISNFRDISYYTENIIISGACFLFWGDLVKTTYKKYEEEQINHPYA